VRRLFDAQRSDALFGNDTDQASYGGYAGQIAWMDWKLIARKPARSRRSIPTAFPVKVGGRCADWAFDGEWEKRNVYILEGHLEAAAVRLLERVLYVDKDIYAIPYSDMYDRGGQLWKIWGQHCHAQERGVPGSPTEIRRETRSFLRS